MSRRLHFFVGGILAAAVVLGSSLSAATRRGTVRDRNGEPAPRVSVIVRDTLDAAVTDGEGHFTLEVPDSGKVDFVLVAPGEREVDQAIEVVAGEALVLTLPSVTQPQVNMDTVTVGGGVTPKSEPRSTRATMSFVDIVLTPGAAGDFNRVIQTLPGVQNVDDGNALFVRGGDYWETAAFINGAVFPSAVRLEAPTGTFVGTVGPFLTKKITFLSGGFGVRYGNLLSGIVEVDTQNRPTDPAATLNVGLGALSFGGNMPVGKQFGFRLTATAFDLGPAMRLNGSARTLSPAPRGSDLSGSAIWEFPRGGELKLFVIRQAQRFGVQVEQPSYEGFFRQNRHAEFGVLSWKDEFGKFSVEGNVSAGSSQSDDAFGGLAATTKLPSRRWFGQIAYPVSRDVSLIAGVEGENVGLRMTGRKPVSFDALAPSSAGTNLGSRVDGRRRGAFVESDWKLRRDLDVVAGVRGDSGSLSHQHTLDPRLTVNDALSKRFTLTGAAGVYHQVPDILFYNPALGGSVLPAMRAEHRILGLQWEEGDRSFKIEVYRKQYRDLTQFTRSRTVARDGVGRSQGIDFMAKTVLPRAVTARLTVSLADVERTDPDSGRLARAPFGIRNSTTLILQRAFSGGYQAGLSWRYGSGRPMTEIAGATYEPTQGIFVPIYGAPFAGKFPETQRLDLTLSKITWRGLHYATVWYLSLGNALNRKNVYDYVYSFDYRERREESSILNRSFYLGWTLMYR